MSIISLKQVSLAFKAKRIFDHFDLQINQGEVVQVKGRSGSGKTTLFKLILGFIRPDQGEISFEEQPLNEKSVWQARKSMAYVSQDMNIGEGVVKDFLTDILTYKANKELTVRKNDVINLFEKFSLEGNLYDSRIDDLSGGEKQRVAIVAALLIDRPVYLLDEVTSALDDELKEQVAEHFMSFTDKTVLVISHDAVWDKYIHRVIHLENIN